MDRFTCWVHWYSEQGKNFNGFEDSDLKPGPESGADSLI